MVAGLRVRQWSSRQSREQHVRMRMFDVLNDRSREGLVWTVQRLSLPATVSYAPRPWQELQKTAQTTNWSCLSRLDQERCCRFEIQRIGAPLPGFQYEVRNHLNPQVGYSHFLTMQDQTLDM